MGGYYAVVRKGQDDYLEHIFGFGKKKGSQKKNHKYVARVPDGDGYRYFYSHAEYAAYQAGKTAKGAVGAVGDAAKGALNTVGNAAKTAANVSGLSKLHKANSQVFESFGYKVKRNVEAVKYGAPKVIDTIKEKKRIPSTKELIKSLKPKTMAEVMAALPIVSNHQKATMAAKKAKESYKDYHDNTPLGRLDKAIWNTTIGRITKKKI